jgi:endonuclease G
MRKLLSILSLFFVIQNLTFGQRESKTNDLINILQFKDRTSQSAYSGPQYNVATRAKTKLELPRTSAGDLIITHTGYSFLYNETCEQAQWVAYELTGEETKMVSSRTDKFIVDPAVKTGTANGKDYSGSGYDKGHMAPAADMGWSQTAMAESFYYSNMSPQVPGFNRGIWKRLEELVRTWAAENELVYIVTGPVLTDGLPTIGDNKVSVPRYFYKVILDYNAPEFKGIGFILPNSSSSRPLQDYAVTIDSVESFTGIDFFPELPDAQESLIESTLSLRSWSWKSSQSSNIKANSSASVQCIAVTKAGVRCRKTTLNESGLCYLHLNQPKSGSILNQDNSQSDHATGKTQSGQTIYTGVRGGKYHYSKSGKKVYESKK